jgi:hypothetical protein
MAARLWLKRLEDDWMGDGEEEDFDVAMGSSQDWVRRRSSRYDVSSLPPSFKRPWIVKAVV